MRQHSVCRYTRTMLSRAGRVLLKEHRVMFASARPERTEFVSAHVTEVALGAVAGSARLV